MAVGAVGNRALGGSPRSGGRGLWVHGSGSVHSRVSFERGRADLAERRMAPPLVIKHLDVVEQGLLRVGVAFEPIALFTLDCREPAFHHGIVVAIAAATHRAGDAVLLESGPIILARVSAALVGVMQEAGVRTAPFHPHLP